MLKLHMQDDKDISLVCKQKVICKHGYTTEKFLFIAKVGEKLCGKGW